jgi:hypothetical protein
MDRRSFLLSAAALCAGGAAFGQGLLPDTPSSAGYCRQRASKALGMGGLDVNRLNSTRSVSDDEGFFEDAVNPRLFAATSAVIQSPSDTPVAQHLIGLINTINTSRYATQVSKNSIDNLLHTDFLLLMAYGLLALDEVGHLDKATKKALLQPIIERVNLSDYKNKFYYGMEQCNSKTRAKPGRDPWDCQNHTYGVQHVRMMMGILGGKKSEIRQGAKLYEYAISDLSAEGALWREAVRGAYSWTYYPHALEHLMAIGDLDARMDGKLLAHTNKRGQSIHDAVRFYVSSLSDPSSPELMRKYSAYNLGVEGRRDGENPYSNWRRQRALGYHYYQAWFPIYRKHFPNRPETKAFARLIRGAKAPELSYHLGLDTWCVFG